MDSNFRISASLFALGALLLTTSGCGSDAPGPTTRDGTTIDVGDADGDTDHRGDGGATGPETTGPDDECDDPDGDGYGPGCALGDDCLPHDPTGHPGAEEICGDGIDNNCNGVIDEGCPCVVGAIRTCYDGPAGTENVGSCRSGYQTCDDSGAWGSCQGQRTPQTEICNGVDNNCNGNVDEGLTNACGVCGPEPVEICNDGLDNNCNGVIDEGCVCDGRTNQPCYSGPPQTLGHGACRGGLYDCIDGAWTACVGDVLPEPEICDGIDNNCNGFIDEGVRNACGGCGPVPEEVCDGIDNNCNGRIDEGVRLPCGLCPGEAGEEICGDGLDNNCNGRIDEGCPCSLGDGTCYPGPPDTIGVGACRAGTRSCDATGEFWGACTGFVLPTIEVCDGIDNNCDGLVDIDARGCSVCGTDVEVCDGVDNNCNGFIDEGVRNACGECYEDVVPERLGGPDLCDGIDNDCNGFIDEGLTNACGTCGESCYVDIATPSSEEELGDGAILVPFDDPENPTGQPGVTLNRRSFIPPYLWAANHTNDTVSKVNTETYVEDGRYWVGQNPSRTAVDLDGNMWVGGRDDGRLTKILWDLDDCPDRNENGTIETSRAGALGPINNASNPLADECVVYSAVPNPARTSIRGVAAGPDGRIWIGYTGGGIQSIDPYTFELGPFYDGNSVPHYRADAAGVIQPVMEGGVQANVAAGGIYGLVVDAAGHLYISSFTRERMSRFDTVTETWVGAYDNFLCGAYGIAVDGRNRIWAGGWPSCRGIGMFDPDTERFHYFTIPASYTMRGGTTTVVEPTPIVGCGSPNYCVTGVGVEPATGDVWASFYAVGYTGRLKVNDANLAASVWEIIPSIRDNVTDALLPGVSNDLRGVGFDGEGFAWTLGLGSNRVFRIDPATNQRVTDLPDGQAIGVGSHYTYSDFTGSTALSFTAPRAFWRTIFETAFDNAQLDEIVWSGRVPTGTTAGIRVRALNADGVAATDWSPAPDGDGTPRYHAFPNGAASSTYTLPTPLIGRSFESDVRLTTTETDVRPIINAIEFIWQRP